MTQKQRFLISKDVVTVPTTEKNFFLQNEECLKIKVDFLPIFFRLGFFKNSKNQNFGFILVSTVEACIEKVHTEFQINWFIRICQLF